MGPESFRDRLERIRRIVGSSSFFLGDSSVSRLVSRTEVDRCLDLVRTN